MPCGSSSSSSLSAESATRPLIPQSSEARRLEEPLDEIVHRIAASAVLSTTFEMHDLPIEVSPGDSPHLEYIVRLESIPSFGLRKRTEWELVHSAAGEDVEDTDDLVVSEAAFITDGEDTWLLGMAMALFILKYLGQVAKEVPETLDGDIGDHLQAIRKYIHAAAL